MEELTVLHIHFETTFHFLNIAIGRPPMVKGLHSFVEAKAVA